MRQRADLLILVLSAFLIVGARAQSVSYDEQSVRSLIQRFAEQRNAHNGVTVAALYSLDGEWISSDGRVIQGRPDLVRLWNAVQGQVQRTIDSVQFLGPNIAEVRVTTQYWEPLGRHHEVFVLSKHSGLWKIRLHQSVD